MGLGIIIWKNLTDLYYFSTLAQMNAPFCIIQYHVIVLLIMIALNITLLYFARLCHLLFYFIAVKEALL